VKRMILSHVQRYAGGSWSMCAPHWLCVAAPCDVEVADIPEATLKQTTGATCCSPRDASKRSTAVISNGQWWNEWLAHVQRYLWQLVNLCTSLALRHRTLQCGSCGHIKATLKQSAGRNGLRFTQCPRAHNCC